ncbi:ABC transporter permease subunit [Streptomyces griseus]|uniref:ABC transporter permease subunit n=1 Tax=Streptomyces griseus TaxID=1911 RepID=UPI00056719DC|nr:ABC transporter permease subunit [Streptomyces griseus]
MSPSSPFSRRTLRAIGLTCSVFAPTLSAGCAGDSSGNSNGKTVIRFNWWGSDSRHEMTKQMIAVYEKEHPNIDVQPEYSNWDDYWKKLSTGRPPVTCPTSSRSPTRILLPISLPALATTAIFTFIWTWNDFLSQLIYLTKPELQTAPVALRNYVDATSGASWGSLFAMSVVTLIPVFVVFLIGQRYLVKGIATTG